MDIQGGELMALNGAGEKLAKHDISLIFTEVLFGPLYEGQGEFHQICQQLSELDHGLFDLYNIVHFENGQIGWGNAIFLSSQLRSSMCSRTP
jgi:hypothetical protein